MKKRLWILVLISLIFTIYMVADTMALFQTDVSQDTTNITPAKWQLKLNNYDISTGSATSYIIMTNNCTTNSNIEEGYIAPGTSCSVPLEVDATGTAVAVRLDITFNIDTLPYSDNITFTVTPDSESESSITTIRTAANTYTGVITLADLEANNSIAKFDVNINWADDETGDYDEDDTKLGTTLYQKINVPVTVHAEQYLGEAITAYTE